MDDLGQAMREIYPDKWNSMRWLYGPEADDLWPSIAILPIRLMKQPEIQKYDQHWLFETQRMLASREFLGPN